MTALGHVDPGGRPLIERLSATVTMIKLSVGTMDNNAYLLRTDSGPAALIDAADEPERIAAQVGERPPEMIITTHQHPDHWQALPDLTERWQPTVIAGTPDAEAIEAGAGVTGIGRVWDGDRIRLGDEELEIIGLVGHTPGSIVIGCRGEVTHLFTGDGLFPGGVGKTGSDADFRSLFDDVRTKIFDVFDDDTVVHPGHGDDTTLGRERPQLDTWSARGW